MKPSSLVLVMVFLAAVGLSIHGCDGLTNPSPDRATPDLLFAYGDAFGNGTVSGLRVADGVVLFSSIGYWPAWSRDGQRISFVEGWGSNGSVTWPRGLVVALSDGSQRSRLATIGGPHSWSPDGSAIAFAYSEWGDHHAESIHVVHTNDGEVGKIADDVGVPFGAVPSWSADGSQVIAGHGTICAARADGTTVNCLGPGSAFSVSPDGSKIVFVLAESLCHHEIFVMDLDGEHRENLSSPKVPNACIRDGHPVWSPDGTRIAFVRSEYPSSSPGTWAHSLYTMNRDGSGIHHLAGPYETLDWGILCPAWSPDGHRIAYVARPHSLRVINVDGTGDRHLVSGYCAQWRPTP
jgi:Tol biopolymer transport system component